MSSRRPRVVPTGNAGGAYWRERWPRGVIAFSVFIALVVGALAVTLWSLRKDDFDGLNNLFQIVDEIMLRLARGHAVEALAMGRHDGLVDLRGLPVPLIDRVRTRFPDQLPDGPGWPSLRMEGLDLSHAWLVGAYLGDATIADSRLDRIEAKGLKLAAGMVRDSSFARADLREAVLAMDTPTPTRWERVSFQKADLHWATALKAFFEDCDFSKANLVRATFGTTLRRSTFAGVLRSVTFDGTTTPETGRPLDRVDFSAAVLQGVRFRSVDLASITPPADPARLLVENWSQTAPMALEQLSQDPRTAARDAAITLEVAVGI